MGTENLEIMEQVSGQFVIGTRQKTLEEELAKIRSDPSGLINHILEDHLSLHGLEGYLVEVARYDIDFLVMAKADVKDLVNGIYSLLEKAYEEYKDKTSEWDKFFYQHYQRGLIKNLRYIEIVTSASIDWERVEKIVPNALPTKVYAPRDSSDTTPCGENRNVFLKIKKSISRTIPFSWYMETRFVDGRVISGWF